MLCMCMYTVHTHTCTIGSFLLLSFPSTLIIIMKETNTQLLMLELQNDRAINPKGFCLVAI